MRLKARVDETQNAIVDALLKAGCKVQTLARLGGGVPDLLVKTPHGLMVVVECKSPGGELTPAQKKWFRYWGDVVVAETPFEALKAVGMPWS